MSGAIGIDWRPLTWNQLHHAYMGRMRVEWERASSLMTMLVNVNSEKRHQLQDLDTFNPFSLSSIPADAEELLERAEKGIIKTNFKMKDLL